MKTTKSISIRFLPETGVDTVYMDNVESAFIESGLWLHVETSKGACRFETSLIESYTVQDIVQLNDSLERKVKEAYLSTNDAFGYPTGGTNKIAAIKVYRTETGACLKDAKRAVERMIEDHDW
jgi:hypothetical protein